MGVWQKWKSSPNICETTYSTTGCVAARANAGVVWSICCIQM